VQTSAGNVLTTSNGMTLYIYDRDDRGRSNCYGECAQHWPPYMANNGSQPGGDMTLVTRSDGRMQWAVNGRPLYTFVQDNNPGEVSGHNVHKDWHVVTYMM
jgi:predicted lipoprotein with Yx(FWY)xxD motif